MHRLPKLAAALALLLAISAPLTTLAASYLPGQTLNPSCLPSDPTCVVVANTAGTFVATSSAATSTFAGNVAVSGNVSFGSLSGILKAVAGVVTTALVNLASDVTGILGISNGGTGTSTAPTYGQVLIGNGSGGYTLTSTSSLGIANGSSQWTSNASNISYNAGSVGIGTTSPSATFSVNGNVYFSGSLAASALTLSTPLAPLSGGLGSYALPLLSTGSTDFFEGDSITAGTGASSCSLTSNSPSGTCWADIVAIHDNVHEINKSVSGTCLEHTTTPGSPCNSSSSLIQRYVADATTLTAGMRVYVLIGTNDVIHVSDGSDPQLSVATFRANLVTVANYFASIVGASNIVLGEITTSHNSNIENPTTITSFNAAIASVAQQYGYSLAETGSAIQSCVLNTGGADSCLSDNVVHPDDAGHAAIAAAFETANYINSISAADSNQKLIATNSIIFNTKFGSFNTAYGQYAFDSGTVGTSTVIGTANSAFGSYSLSKNTTGASNTGIGYSALKNNTSGSQNTATGFNALFSNTNGNGNSAFGIQSLYSNTTGGNNTASGLSALFSNTTGTANTAYGENAALSNTSGSDNVAIGMQSLYSNVTGNYNTALGFQSLYANVAGNNNAVMGISALRNATSSSNNSIFGSFAGNQMSGANGAVGSGNSLFGYQSGYDLTTGSNNTILGQFATIGSGITSGSNNIVIGNDLRVGIVQSGSNQLNIGNLIFGSGIGSGMAVSTGNIGIGTSTSYSRLEVWGPDSAASTTAFSVVNNASTTEFAILDNGNATLAGNLIQSSDLRLKTNITSIDTSSSLAKIEALNPVTFNWIDPEKNSVPQFGFIAQDVQKIFPNLVSVTAPTPLTPDGTLSLNYIDLISPIVASIQALDKELNSLASAVSGFAQSITTAVLNATTGNFGQVNANMLCLGSTCVTQTQLQALLAAAKQSASAPASASSASSTPPVIEINGSNPAVIDVGAAYSDLGATITGPAADLNLGIATFVNGVAMSPVAIDTSAAATDTIDYVVTDPNGLTSTSTRTVIVQAPAAPSAATTTAQ